MSNLPIYHYFRPWLPESPREEYVNVLPKARVLVHRGDFSNCLSLLQGVFHIDEERLHHDDLEVLNLIVNCMEQFGSRKEEVAKQKYLLSVYSRQLMMEMCQELQKQLPSSSPRWQRNLQRAFKDENNRG